MLKAKRGRSHSALRQKTIADQLDHLTTLDAPQLRALWPEQFGRKAPPHMQRETLARILAYDVQVCAFGGLSKSVAKTLDRVAAEEFGELDDNRSPASKRQLTPGMRLVREWRGDCHEVCITEDGFVWGDTSYRSLSAVARALTGTRWNGPAFFGLRSKGST